MSGPDKSIIELQWKNIKDDFCKNIELLSIAKRVWIDPLVIVKVDEGNRKVFVGIDPDKQGYIKELLESKYKICLEDSIKTKTLIEYQLIFVYQNDGRNEHKT